MTKGMTVTVLRPANGFDGTNKGISSRVATITVIGPNIPEISEPTDRAPAFEIGSKPMGKGEYYLFLVPAGHAGHTMMGGNYAVAYDSRWTFGALPIHDRTETAEESAALSR